jgi:hypothetical protein
LRPVHAARQRHAAGLDQAQGARLGVPSVQQAKAVAHRRALLYDVETQQPQQDKTTVYAKIFAQIYDGTLCTNGPWEALVTFQQLLILADQEGSVDMTIPAIERRTTIPREILERGISALMRPDPDSRTPTEEGRRIVPLAEGRSWGWRVVNYVMYRQIKREEDRREYHREYWHKRKLKDSTKTQQAQPNQPIANANADAEAKKEEKTPRKRSAPPAKPLDVSDQEGETSCRVADSR